MLGNIFAGEQRTTCFTPCQNRYIYSFFGSYICTSYPGICMINMYVVNCYRLRWSVHSKVSFIVSASPVQAGMRDMLPALQLRSSRHGWKLRRLPLLRYPHHPRRQTQVSLIQQHQNYFKQAYSYIAI